jgi:hypothetical protein
MEAGQDLSCFRIQFPGRVIRMKFRHLALSAAILTFAGPALAEININPYPNGAPPPPSQDELRDPAPAPEPRAEPIAEIPAAPPEAAPMPLAAEAPQSVEALKQPPDYDAFRAMAAQQTGEETPQHPVQEILPAEFQDAPEEINVRPVVLDPVDGVVDAQAPAPMQEAREVATPAVVPAFPEAVENPGTVPSGRMLPQGVQEYIMWFDDPSARPQAAPSERVYEEPPVEEASAEPAKPLLPVVKTWKASRGANMRETLQQWAQDAGAELNWKTDDEFAALDDVKVEGTFEDAVAALLEQYQDNSLRPVGDLHISPATDKRVLTISTDQKS